MVPREKNHVSMFPHSLFSKNWFYRRQFYVSSFPFSGILIISAIWTRPLVTTVIFLRKHRHNKCTAWMFRNYIPWFHSCSVQHVICIHYLIVVASNLTGGCCGGVFPFRPSSRQEIECNNNAQQILAPDKTTSNSQQGLETKVTQIQLSWLLHNPFSLHPKRRESFHDDIKTAIQDIFPNSQVTRSGIDKPLWTLHLRAQVSTIMHIPNIQKKLVRCIQSFYTTEPTDLETMKEQMSKRNSHQVLEDTEPWTEGIWWSAALGGQWAG